jgi:CO/xanthine dehydrogenase Mo-binding subunit
METTQIGTSVRRLDYETKVTGRAQYVADMIVPGMCHGKILRSPTRMRVLKESTLPKPLKSPASWRC